MITIRSMTAADVSLGMRLKAEAGWNQLPADWQRFLAMQPDGCFVAESDGVGVGTAAACVFDSVAWIAMVLVDAKVRGRGIGKALMQHALAYADAQGANSVRLDATPLGQPLYEKLGFLPQYELHRYAGRLDDRRHLAPRDALHLAEREVYAGIAQPEEYAAILALDQSVTHTDRSKFLLRLFAEQPAGVRVIRQGDQLLGYLAIRPGSQAVQVGPCITENEAGELLLRDACQRLAGETAYLDVPVQNERAVCLATSAGLTVQRQLTRMCRGTAVNDDVLRLWASSGPELG